APRRHIPVGRGRIQRWPLVLVILLDAALKGLLERHILGHLPAVDRHVATTIAVVVGLVMVGVLEQCRAAPRVAKVILRPRAERGRELHPINEELLVAFPPPP